MTEIWITARDELREGLKRLGSEAVVDCFHAEEGIQGKEYDQISIQFPNEVFPPNTNSFIIKLKELIGHAVDELKETLHVPIIHLVEFVEARIVIQTPPKPSNYVSMMEARELLRGIRNRVEYGLMRHFIWDTNLQVIGACIQDNYPEEWAQSVRDEDLDNQVLSGTFLVFTTNSTRLKSIDIMKDFKCVFDELGLCYDPISHVSIDGRETFEIHHK